MCDEEMEPTGSLMSKISPSQLQFSHEVTLESSALGSPVCIHCSSARGGVKRARSSPETHGPRTFATRRHPLQSAFRHPLDQNQIADVRLRFERRAGAPLRGG